MIQILLLACIDYTTVPSQAPGDFPLAEVVDQDGDGYIASADCDDADPDVNPGAVEICDGLDQDCDGRVDEEASDAEQFYRDEDEDGYGDPLLSYLSCTPNEGYVSIPYDCDDQDPSIHPYAEEFCDDVDRNCDGVPGTEQSGPPAFTDADGDGYGDPEERWEGCELPDGLVDNPHDCDDSSAAIHPKAEELCDGLDNNCDLSVDEGFLDADEDGIANCVDPTIYEEDFSGAAWEGWEIVSLHDQAYAWTWSGGELSERSDAGKTVAMGPELGEVENYSVEVDLSCGAIGSFSVGVVFAWQSEDEFWVARWKDPTGYYYEGDGYFAEGGQVDLLLCRAGECEAKASWEGAPEHFIDAGSWGTWWVEVQGQDIRLGLDGDTVLEHVTTAPAPVGADRVGIYSSDNDSGCSFDDFVVLGG